MLTPISWLREFVEIDIPAEALAERLTLAGLEVAQIRYIGLPQREIAGIRQPPSRHLVWSREKIRLGAILEIEKHPNADRLVIAIVDIGADEPVRCVTGAPNLFSYAGKGQLATPLWVAWAGAGAELWDGHSETPRRMTLKGRKIRGIYNDSMVCSERELGISDEHEGILLIENEGRFPAGAPLQDVLGDIILDIELTPNLARCFSILGVAREVAALLDQPLREPSYEAVQGGASIAGQVELEIRQPPLNPRFTFALLRDTRVGPSPWLMQWRLKLVGQRPINNIVDVTNYITLEIGQPLHAYDYDLLVERAGGGIPCIHTRTPVPGEDLITLDQENRALGAEQVLVCDEAGALGLGGVIGGASTAIHDGTRNVLLEAASWNYINTRRTMNAHNLHTSAAIRFSRGVHPAVAPQGVRRGIELMRSSGGGQIVRGIIDVYPLPAAEITVQLATAEVHRLLGVSLSRENIAAILQRLQFATQPIGEHALQVTVPPHRQDISDDPVTGQADLIEEIARVYGYDRLPSTIMADAMPEQWANHELLWEEKTRDLLASYGLRENIGYRFTTPEREAALAPAGQESPFDAEQYVRITNPIAADKTVLRQSLLSGMLKQLAENRRWRETQQVFEIGPVFRALPQEKLPLEENRLAILLSGPRPQNAWLADERDDDAELLDFYDMKGVIHALLHDLHVAGWQERRSEQPHLHPGRSADIWRAGQRIASYGELHPIVARNFSLADSPLLVAEMAFASLQAAATTNFPIPPLPTTPPVLQDIALIVPEQTTHEAVSRVIARAGGAILREARCFDVYTGAPIPEGRKSLAFKLTYQAQGRTLTDKEVARVHRKIARAAERELGATLRA